MFKLLLVAVPLFVFTFLGDAADVHQGNVLMVGENSITIQDKDGVTETFVLAEDCKIMHSGKPATLKEIDNGDVARVTVATVKGKLIATAIDAKCRE